MAEPGIGEFATAYAQARSLVLKNHVADSDPLMYLIKKFKGMKTVKGGDYIVEEILYGANPNVAWINDLEQLGLARTAQVTAAKYLPKMIGGSLVISTKEKLMNQGPGRYIDIMKARMQALEDTISNKVKAAVQSDGTGNGGKEFGGTKLIVSKTPSSGTIGNIDSSAVNWWRNVAIATASSTIVGPGGLSETYSAGAVSSSTVEQAYDACIDYSKKDNVEKVNVGYAGNTHWRAFLAATRTYERRTSSEELVKIGVENVQYRGVPIVHAGGVNFSGETQFQVDRTDFYNTKHLKVQFYEGGNFEVYDAGESNNQFVIAKKMLVMGNVTCSARAFQATVFDS